jgi:hypothetical protein
MASIQVITGPLDDEQRGEALFGGDVLIFKDVAPLRRLSTLASEFVRAVFGEAPAHAQFALGTEEFKARASALVERWQRDPAALEGFRQVLRDVGVELDRGYWDWLHLRIQPHQDFTKTGTLGHHRDTWSSNIYAQTNWWTPILPITRERTIALYPAYWSRPLANTSATWDLERVREMPIVPRPTEPVDADSELRIVIEPRSVVLLGRSPARRRSQHLGRHPLQRRAPHRHRRRHPSQTRRSQRRRRSPTGGLAVVHRHHLERLADRDGRAADMNPRRRRSQLDESESPSHGEPDDRNGRHTVLRAAAELAPTSAEERACPLTRCVRELAS